MKTYLIMFANLRVNKILWFVTTFLALIAGLVGVVIGDVYDGLIEEQVIPGAVAQDLVVAIIALISLVQIIRVKASDHSTQILILGTMGFYFYAFGIYTIEQVYNIFYLIYLAIFSLSFYSMAYSLAHIDRELVRRATLDNSVRKYSLFYMLFNPIVFYPLWLSQLIPLLLDGNRIENLFSIYIIDLGFIMPAFLILSYLTYQKRGIGYVLAVALYVVGFAILIPLSIGEIMKPIFFGMEMDIFSVFLFLILSGLFLVLTYYQLKKLEFEG